MSLQDLSEKSSRLSIREPWEKFIESLESDTLETNETTEKTFDSDGLLINSIRRKDSDIQRFIDETDRKCMEREWPGRALKEARQEIEILHEQVMELESELRQEMDKSHKLFNAVESLEKENEKLQEENEKLRETNGWLSERLHGVEKQIAIAKRESSNQGNLTRPRRETVVSRKEYEDTRITRIKRMRTEASLSAGRNKKLDDSYVESDSIVHRKSYLDDRWLKKIRCLKEKLLCGEKRNKNLEFLVLVQKKYIEDASKTINELKAEKLLAETKQEKMKKEFNALVETRLREKSKLDNVISFCDLMNNCSFSAEELSNKLRNLPVIISSFLKGTSDALAFKESHNHPALQPAPLIKCKKTSIVSPNNGSERLQDRNFQQTAKELRSIKHTFNHLANTLMQAMTSTDSGALIDLEKKSQVHMTLEEGLKTESRTLLNPHLSERDLRKNRNNCPIFVRAIRNCSSFPWQKKFLKGFQEESGNSLNGEQDLEIY